MSKRNCSIMSILVLALMFIAVFSPRADARPAYLTSCMSASQATGCHPSAAGVAGQAPTLTTTDCKSCHHHGLSSTPVVTTDKTSYASTDNILFKFTGGSQTGRAGLVVYNLAGTSEVARGAITEDNSATLSVPASAFGAISNTAIKTAWHGNAINTTNGTSNVCTTAVPCTAHEFSAVINTPAITIAGACTRVAPTVTFNTTAQSVAAGGTVTYTATITNKDSGASCTNSTFALSVASETGTAANFVLPSTVSATSPNPCSLAPGGTCTATVTVKAQTSATAGAADATTINAADATNHSAQTGSGAVTTTVAAVACTRAAPTVTFNTTAQSVNPGATVTYTATVTNRDSGTSCTNSTFALSVASETGTAANFVLPSTVSVTSPNPCSLAPGGTCTATVTVKAQTAATAGATDATTINAADSTNHAALPGSGAVTSTVAAVPTCTRVAPTVTFNTTAQTVTAGGSITYTATVTNKDSSGCSNSTFAFSIGSETGTAANFVLPSTLSASSPNPCALAPGGTCTATLTVKAQTAATAGATDVTTVNAADSTNHASLPGSGAVTSTTAAASATYTLTVASSNPTSGVAVTVSPNDTTGKGNGTTQFTRTYNSGTVVTLTAPAKAGSNPFMKWQKGGADYAATAKITVMMTANTTMTAIFGSSTANYTILARNDLGMHCACPTFTSFLLLPPYNTLRVQVLKKGSWDASLITSGVSVNYAIAEETDASLQADPYYSQWIAFSPKLFPGFKPVVNGKVQGLAGNGITGTATYDSTSRSWNAVGIPAYPITSGDPTKDVMFDPIGGPNRDPYLTAIITVNDSKGSILGTTSTTVPVAFGGCCACHLALAGDNGYPATPAGSFAYLGKMHSQNGSKIDFSLIDPDGDGVGGPIRCSWCHWDPAMSEADAPGLPTVWPNYKILPGAGFTSADIKKSVYSFSDVLHRFHAQDQKVLTQYDPNIATNCYDCHPGNGADCYRGVHKGKTAIWCTDCHGNLNQRIAAGQLAQPWQQSTLPSCFATSPGATSTFSCHAHDTTNSWSWQGHRDHEYTGYTLDNTAWPGLFGKFINNRGHKGSILCESCHGSAHGEAPSTLAADNVQNATLQGSSSFSFPSGKDSTYPIGVCNVCHTGKSNTWSRPNHDGN